MRNNAIQDFNKLVEVSEEDLSKAWIDERGVKYSADRKRLLEAAEDMEGGYTIPIGTEVICNNAFSHKNCKLNNIILSEGLQVIGKEAFLQCEYLRRVTIPKSLISIGESVFEQCINLYLVNFNAIACELIYEDNCFDEIMPIFLGCKNLLNVRIGSEVSIIPRNMFYGCNKLIEITIPESVTKIEWEAFYGCTNLKVVNYNAVACQVDINYSGFWKSNKSGEWEYGDVISIFNECTNLKKVNIGSNVKIIPAGLLADCKFIKEIIIPENIKEIGKGAFSGCMNLKKVYFNAENYEISYYDSLSWLDDEQICDEDYYAPQSWLEQYHPIFENCPELYEVTIGKNVTTLPEALFDGCIGLKEVNYKAEKCEVSELAVHAPVFNNCPKLNEVYIEGTVRVIPSYLFHCSSLKKLIFLEDDNLSFINYNAFSYCDNLEYLHIPQSVKEIGEKAFESCYNLTKVILPEDIEYISVDAFDECESLKKIVIERMTDEKENNIIKKFDNLLPQFKSKFEIDDTEFEEMKREFMDRESADWERDYKESCQKEFEDMMDEMDAWGNID